MQQGNTPFLRLLIPFCAGIIFSEVSDTGWLPGAAAILAGAGGLMLFSLRENYTNNPSAGVSIFLIIAGSGFLLHLEEKKSLILLPESEETYLLRIKDFPERKTKSYSFSASVCSSVFNPQSRQGGNILIYLAADSAAAYLKPGELINVRLKPVPVTNNGNPCEFNYRRYLAGHGVRYMAFIRYDAIISHTSPKHRTITEYSSVASRRVIGIFSSAGLKGDDLGLVTALTLGEKEFLNKEYLTSFSKAGVMHVMAVSGMHVGMISLFLSYALFFLNKKLTVLKTGLILIALWLFAFVTGLSPSVMRATLMFSFLQAGTLMKKTGNSLNLLMASAFILLAARPSVLFEAGFQLSYIAVLFIILFYEPFYRLQKIKSKPGDYLWQMISVSAVAQAGTFPLVVRLFNTFPVMFLVSNLVIVPLSFIIIILALILLPLSQVGPVAHLITGILTFLSHVTLGFTQLISSMQYGVVQGIGLTAAGTMILTLSVALLLASVLKVIKTGIRPFLVSALIFVMAGIFTDIRERNRERIIIYNIRGKGLPAIQSGRDIYLFMHPGKLPAEVSRHASTRRLKIHYADPGRETFIVKETRLCLSADKEVFLSAFDGEFIEMHPGSEVEYRRSTIYMLKSH